ncbi:hypothetical protein [Micromonospora tulbaghiae]|uniref:hypothetical protein n=1 Tax=Micromonospora tulbaghiae TaxID=479978 RepID=UPI00367A45C5
MSRRTEPRPRQTSAAARALSGWHIARLVDEAPPLTDEQRARLAGLLLPAAGQAERAGAAA